jgi:uncharacterized protein
VSIKIFDEVYGEHEIDEDVLVDIINSRPLQRLKGISQNGLPDEYYHKKGFSRYDHSTGVMLILRKLNASIEEQIAGLIHDISHTAFSHVVDWVMGDVSKSDYQDNMYEEYFVNTEIPDILERYGYNYKEFVNLEAFSLLEQEAPNLCGDRLDYTLREIYFNQEDVDIDLILKGLIVKDKKIMFDNVSSAEIFSKGYVKGNEEHWCGVEARARYLVLSDILKMALSKGIINKDDFWKTDKEVFEKLLASEDKYSIDRLNLLKDKLRIVEGKEGFLLKKKFRYIDPEVFLNGEVRRLSEVSLDYKNILNQKLNERSRELKIIIRGHHE